MSNNSDVTNITIVRVDSSNAKAVKEVKTGQIFTSNNSFHPEGLFSTEIFGSVGSELRSVTFGRINLNLKVLHPIIYLTVVNLKAFYKQIMEGKQTAVFDKKSGEFVKSISPEANTGYNFFIEHFKELKFQESGSNDRKYRIKLIEKAVKDNSYLMEYLLVMPAGLRDYTVDKNGKPSEDEVNTFYRRILAQSTIIDPLRSSKSPEIYDSASVGVQNTIVELYEYIKTLLDGKNKLVLDKWVGRKIFNSTRNVISSYMDRSTGFNDKRKLGYNDSLVGLHQYARASYPKSGFEIKNKYVPLVFPENTNSSFVTDIKTWKKVEVVSGTLQKDYDLFVTPDGIEKLIASLGSLDSRELPLVLGRGKYLFGLLYRDDKVFKFFQDIDDLPEGFDKKFVKPINLFEFIYMSIYHMDGKYPGFLTRYPITGYGSIYPTMVRFSTSVKTDTLRELGDNWEPIDGDDHLAVNFPIPGEDHVNTLIPHPSHLGRLGGDYDGDTASLTMLLSDESIEEVNSFLNSREYYIDDQGNLNFQNNVETLEVVMKYMT